MSCEFLNNSPPVSNSFRCGLFYLDPNEPPPDEGGKPAFPLLIMNATWDASGECPGGNYDRYQLFCNSIVSTLTYRVISVSKSRMQPNFQPV